MQYRNMRMPTDKGSLSVLGSSSIEVLADTAIICTSIASEGTSLEEARNKNYEVYNIILKSLADYKIQKENIYDKNVSATKNPNSSGDTTYTVSHLLTVVVNDFSKLNDIYSLIIKNGTNDSAKINFTLSDSVPYYNRALKKATQDAVSKASILARNFGVKYNPVPYRIRENTSSLYSITYPSYDDCNYTSASLPGYVSISAEIEASFSTYQY